MDSSAPDGWIFSAVESGYCKVSIPHRYATRYDEPPIKKSGGAPVQGSEQNKNSHVEPTGYRHVNQKIILDLLNSRTTTARRVLYTTAKAIISILMAADSWSMERYPPPDPYRFEILDKDNESDNLGRLRTDSGEERLFESRHRLKKGARYELVSCRHRRRPDGVTVVEILEVVEL